ncbi:flavodoxin family protein [uncultured Roseovarius sp.]|uniref:flavodoxin family protein n=1 Tax=uncultured Roseovarius sp. TaxID=293344 RepID=UPI00262FCB62|nr:NAD(P)H-dependent oxidoreductase [uncultured Roseovarius sp.]
MNRVACLLGSPRAGGNSDLLAKAFCDEVARNGGVVEWFPLRDLRFKGCVSLRHCKSGGETCGLKDDLNPVLEAVAAADIVVVATPIYFCNISGLFKQALDRFFSFFVPDYVTAAEPSRLGRGKAFVLVQVQGEGAERYGNLLDQYGPALDKLGFERRELIRASGVREVGDVVRHTEAMDDATSLARRLTGAA